MIFPRKYVINLLNSLLHAITEVASLLRGKTVLAVYLFGENICSLSRTSRDFHLFGNVGISFHLEVVSEQQATANW